MKIEDFARYIDTIAPSGTPPDAADERLGATHDGRRSGGRALVGAISGLAVVAVIALAMVVVSTGGDQGTDVATEPTDDPASSTVAPTTPSTDPPTTTSATDPTGGFSVGPPDGPRITLELVDEVAVAQTELLVSHQVGFTIDSYGYDALLHESVPIPFDPCSRAQPCDEVAEPVTNAAGLVVRSWAPTLVPGAEPSSPTMFTIEVSGGGGPTGDVLAIPASYAGAPLPSDELAAALSHLVGTDGAGTFSADLEGRAHETTWVATMIQPPAPSVDAAEAEWILYLTPGCDGADRCEYDIGVSSLSPPRGEWIPVDDLVRSVTVEH